MCIPKAPLTAVSQKVANHENYLKTKGTANSVVGANFSKSLLQITMAMVYILPNITLKIVMHT